MLTHSRSLRKKTGGLRRPHHKKKKRELQGYPALTKIEKQERKRIMKVRGGNRKIKLYGHNKASVSDPKTGKTKLAEIKTVIKNPANVHFTRMNIITRGAIIETDLGKARVTSKPGQVGVIQAILIKE